VQALPEEVTPGQRPDQLEIQVPKPTTICDAVGALIKAIEAKSAEPGNGPAFSLELKQVRAALAASSMRICAMCGYVGAETDHIGQCPRCHWDELLEPHLAAGEAIGELRGVLCNPEGKCCISGTKADRIHVDVSLAALDASLALMRDAQARMTERHRVDLATATDEQRRLSGENGVLRGLLRECSTVIEEVCSENPELTERRHLTAFLQRIADAASKGQKPPADLLSGAAS
jgi:hypothetical protein